MFQLHVFVNQVEHLVEFEAVNLDVFTETFNMNFYFNYLTRWPECCAVARRKSVQNKLKQGANLWKQVQAWLLMFVQRWQKQMVT